MKQLLTKCYYNLKRPNVVSYFNEFKRNEFIEYESLKQNQELQLRKLIYFVYENVPYYNKLFNKSKIKPDYIKNIKNLELIPVLTKEIIKEHEDEFIPQGLKNMNYVNGSTGGSTGKTLKYRMSLEDYERGIALAFRGWGYAGYELGDKMAVIAGASLVKNGSIKPALQGLFLNRKMYSTFQMSEEKIGRYVVDLNMYKPQFIQGYVSAIYLLAKYVKDKKLKVLYKPSAIFTTSEKLLQSQRTLIEDVFQTEVFDTYGINDGGLSAFECKKHNGMHVDMERGILEIADDNGRQIYNEKGKILATALYNYATPFIRYDTGDFGIISLEGCKCGSPMPLLKEIVGRETDYLEINNVRIASPVITVLMGKFDIQQYQIIQYDKNAIRVKIVKGKNYSESCETEIFKCFSKFVGYLKIDFEYIDIIIPNNNNKHKFIIRDI